MTRSTLRRWTTVVAPAALAVVLALCAPTSSVAAPQPSPSAAQPSPETQTATAVRGDNGCDDDSSWGGR
ncbi:hypothetical protein JGS22_021195 [Streptomyces sp. P38-E01]|uniref:Uncharacterized protein n=1 Tax=Streptomyces tardus TaxID=2780544 RepID=A0A949N3I8_9ACTN|nr:hypothetical protein [Streptomyces tardus]MBU7600080.1 hypothetical protein [Streptomyces tardus]